MNREEMLTLPQKPAKQQLHMVWPQERLREPPTWSLPAGYILRTWQEGDGEGYARLVHEAGFKLWRLETILQQSLPGGLFFVVAQEGSQIVATAVARHLPTELHPFGGELGYVIVDPQHRGKGLGDVVSAAATKRLLDAGYTDVYLRTDDERLAALKIYLGLGYVPYLYAPGMEERWQAILRTLDWPRPAAVRAASGA